MTFAANNSHASVRPFWLLGSRSDRSSSEQMMVVSCNCAVRVCAILALTETLSPVGEGSALRLPPVRAPRPLGLAGAFCRLPTQFLSVACRVERLLQARSAPSQPRRASLSLGSGLRRQALGAQQRQNSAPPSTTKRKAMVLISHRSRQAQVHLGARVC
jgi:hypothetical protein